jgi:uncharacterized protein (DUF58 family)
MTDAVLSLMFQACELRRPEPQDAPLFLAAAELLREAVLTLRRKHRPILVNLEDPDLAALVRARPANVEAAFAQVSAMEIVLANRRLGRRLHRNDIPVASAPADRLAWETLAVYLRAALGARGAVMARRA